MNILVINPIMYTNETKNIKKVDTLKDTLIYNVCLGFLEVGINVTLITSLDYKPIQNEEYPFKVIFLKTKLKKNFFT